MANQKKSNKQLMKKHQEEAAKFEKLYQAELDEACLKFGKAFLDCFDDESEEYKFMLKNAKRLGEISKDNVENLKKKIEDEKVQKSLDKVQKKAEKSLNEVQKETESGFQKTENTAEKVLEPKQGESKPPQVTPAGVNSNGTHYYKQNN